MEERRERSILLQTKLKRIQTNSEVAKNKLKEIETKTIESNQRERKKREHEFDENVRKYMTEHKASISKRLSQDVDDLQKHIDEIRNYKGQAREEVLTG